MASASTVDLSTADGFYINVTGTTTITALGTEAAGIHYVLKFAGALTFTHNATSLILPSGANITTAAGDIAWMMSEGSGNWRCLFYQRASDTATNATNLTGSGTVSATATGGALLTPTALAQGTQGYTLTEDTATTSGTSITVSSIPSWARKVHIIFNGVSTSGTSIPIIQIGPVAGVETTGYLANAQEGTGNYASTVGFPLGGGTLATSKLGGVLTLFCASISNNTWIASGNIAHIDSSTVSSLGGTKSLAGALSVFKLTTVGGSDTFDFGSISIAYE